jgi:hypothetical protein
VLPIHQNRRCYPWADELKRAQGKIRRQLEAGQAAGQPEWQRQREDQDEERRQGSVRDRDLI